MGRGSRPPRVEDLMGRGSRPPRVEDLMVRGSRSPRVENLLGERKQTSWGEGENFMWRRLPDEMEKTSLGRGRRPTGEREQTSWDHTFWGS